MELNQKPLNVAFWNVQDWGVRDGALREQMRFGRIMTKVLSTNPDVISFLECKSPVLDMYLWPYRVAYSIHSTNSTPASNARIITMVRHSFNYSVRFSECKEFPQRHASLIEIETPIRKLNILSLHAKAGMTCFSHDLRKDTWRKASDIALNSRDEGAECIIMGDMNTVGHKGLADPYGPTPPMSSVSEAHVMCQIMGRDRLLAPIKNSYPQTWMGVGDHATHANCTLDYVFASPGLAASIGIVHQSGWNEHDSENLRRQDVLTRSDHTLQNFRIPDFMPY